ncbi:MAG: Npun_F0494 family protein [Stenomitos frigidus ULC029]
MTVISSTCKTIAYPDRTVLRAERAMRCAPFQLALYTTMVQQSVSLLAIAGQAGLTHGYTSAPLSELIAEAELLWLIQVGLLRREVDGQGLTDSFRVTPLGRQLVQKWQEQGSVRITPTLGDRLHHAWNRWFRLPI